MNPLSTHEQKELVSILRSRSIIHASIAGSYRHNAANEASDIDVFAIKFYTHLELLKGVNKGAPQEKVILSTGKIIDLRIHCLSVLLTLTVKYYPCLIESILSDDEHLLINDMGFDKEINGELLFDSNVVHDNAVALYQRALVRSNAERHLTELECLHDAIVRLENVEDMNAISAISLASHCLTSVIKIDQKNKYIIVAAKKRVDFNASVSILTGTLVREIKSLTKLYESQKSGSAGNAKIAAQYFRNFCIARKLLMCLNSTTLNHEELKIFTGIRSGDIAHSSYSRKLADVYVTKVFVGIDKFECRPIAGHIDRLDKLVIDAMLNANKAGY